MLKIVGMDFDSTLVDHGSKTEKIGKPIVESLDRFIENGNQAGIVTGRPYESVVRAFRDYDVKWGPFPSFVIAREAYIISSQSGIDNLPPEAKQQADEWNISMDKKLYDLCRRISPRINSWLGEINSHGINIYDFYLFGNYAFEFHVDTNDIADETVEILKEITLRDGFPDAEVHHNNVLVSVIHKDGGKGNVLSRLTEIVGCEPGKVLACGDSFNDLSMLDGSKGFICGCVGNADPKLKKSVCANGGYCAEGTAWRGVLELFERFNDKKGI